MWGFLSRMMQFVLNYPFWKLFLLEFTLFFMSPL